MLEECLDEPSNYEVVKHGQCIARKERSRFGKKTEVVLYKYKNKTYISQYINKKCITFNNVEHIPESNLKAIFESVKWKDFEGELE